jgi:DNA-binding response OmpR family regulator
LKILIVEHEPALGLFLARSLEKEGHAAIVLDEGTHGISSITSADYDLLILDVDSPDGMAAQVLETARQFGNGMRVLVLASGAADLEVRMSCFEAGADDCLAKPFAMRELKARCRALGRRHDGTAVIRCGGLELNRLEQRLACDEGDVPLSRREFAVLEFLMLNRGSCVSRATLLEHVWSTGEGGNTNLVDVYINYLRRKLGANGSLIETVRGRGYRIGNAEAHRHPVPVPLTVLPAFQQQAVS